MSKERIHINAKVNTDAIRRETHNGREHIVIPSRTLPFGVVMNGGLYPREEIEANYKSLNDTLAPLGHPTVNGKNVSAFSPEGINAHHIGAWNRNARIEGNRVYVEKWVDIEVAQQSEGGKKLLERVADLEAGKGEPIHTSVAAWVEREPAVNADGYSWTARISGMDHDAILLDQPGAATPEQGVGLMVNADQAQLHLSPNSGALVGETFRERERRLENAVKERWPNSESEYAWIGDFTATQVIVIRNGGKAELYGYKVDGGKFVLDDTGTAVQRQESWIAMAVNAAKKFFQQQDCPATNQKEGDMPLTAEERADIVKDVGASVSTIVADALKGVNDKVDSLAANHKALADKLTVNERNQEKEQRDAVAAKLGEVVANALSGEALAAAYAQCATAKPIGAGITANSQDKPDFGQAAD